MHLSGFHHLTAITADARGNHAFYTGVLGLRLVKKTVNQDDVSAYHLFYADGDGSPGTDITFFDWRAVPERRGTRSIARTAWGIGSEQSLAYWAERLSSLDVHHTGVQQRDGRATIDLEDPEGQRLSLVVEQERCTGTPHPWENSPVPPEHQLLGLGPITLSVPDLEPTQRFLEEVLNLRWVREYAGPATSGSDDVVPTHVFAMDAQGADTRTQAWLELHVALEPHLPPARSGAGGVHHVAFRIPTFEQYDQWAQRLRELRVANSGPIDRFYFRSLYFREPAGILFELATDDPGFTADEPRDALGQRLSLPPFLEPRRAEIEAGLHSLDF